MENIQKFQQSREEEDKKLQDEALKRNSERPLKDKLLFRKKTKPTDVAHENAIEMDQWGQEVVLIEEAIISLGKKEGFWVPAISNFGLRGLIKELLDRGWKFHEGNGEKIEINEQDVESLYQSIVELGQKEKFWVPAISNGGLKGMLNEIISRGWKIENQ